MPMHYYSKYWWMKPRFLVPVCFMLIIGIALLHFMGTLTNKKRPNTNNNKNNNKTMASSANGNNDNELEPKQQQHQQHPEDGKNETKLGFQESWVEQQERELADLLSLGQCNNNLKTKTISDDDDDDEARLPPLNDWSAMCRGISIERDFESLMRPNCRNRYLLPDYTYCSGLGNQMFRFASLYGIGRASCRRPIFKKGVQECVNGERQKEEWRHHDRETPDEIEKLFPLYNSQLKYINFSEISASDIRYVDGFATKCCTYDDPARLQLHAMKEKFVQFKKTDFLQHYKFFDSRRKDMRQIFQFAPKICKSVLASKCKLFETDRTSYKFCVHNRLSDFVQAGWQSDLHFAVNATKYIVNELKPKFGNISIVLLGSERDFLDKIEQKLDKDLYTKLYIPETKSRGEDLAFVTIACDSLLITAPASTFSWWMAYLMPDRAQIYYSAHLEKTPRGKDSFLKDWTALRMVNGTITPEK